MSNEKKHLTPRDLALFLGCEVEWMGEPGYISTGVNTGDERLNPIGLQKNSYQYWARVDEVRPVLRQLVDITEQEARRAYEIAHGTVWDTDDSCKEYLFEPATRNIKPIKIALGKPEVWAYFLSICLDVFGWIPAGLAVDATKKEVEI